MTLSPFESWALLLLAATTLTMLLRVHHLTGQRVHTCDWCGQGYRTGGFHVGNRGVIGTCCCWDHADLLAESIWLGQP